MSCPARCHFSMCGKSMGPVDDPPSIFSASSLPFCGLSNQSWSRLALGQDFEQQQLPYPSLSMHEGLMPGNFQGPILRCRSWRSWSTTPLGMAWLWPGRYWIRVVPFWMSPASPTGFHPDLLERFPISLPYCSFKNRDSKKQKKIR